MHDREREREMESSSSHHRERLAATKAMLARGETPETPAQGESFAAGGGLGARAVSSLPPLAQLGSPLGPSTSAALVLAPFISPLLKPG